VGFAAIETGRAVARWEECIGRCEAVFAARCARRYMNASWWVGRPHLWLRRAACVVPSFSRDNTQGLAQRTA